MSLSIYMDVHIPMAVTAGLRRRNIDVLTSQQDGTAQLSDDRLMERASELSRVLFSQDDDLLRLASLWQQKGKAFSGILYAHQLSAGIGTLVKDIELLLSCSTADELTGRVTYLPLR
jgi:predicted nuclease of predicted toxin-antitoxin system